MFGIGIDIVSNWVLELDNRLRWKAGGLHLFADCTMLTNGEF